MIFSYFSFVWLYSIVVDVFFPCKAHACNPYIWNTIPCLEVSFQVCFFSIPCFCTFSMFEECLNCRPLVEWLMFISILITWDSKALFWSYLPFLSQGMFGFLGCPREWRFMKLGMYKQLRLAVITSNRYCFRQSLNFSNCNYNTLGS